MNISDAKDLPIGFMDSGLGGLSVLREAIRLMPCEDFIYFGDSANAPYGTKDTKTIRALTFSAVKHLTDRGIKGLAVACNTATGAAVRELRIAYPHMPIVGIEPAIKPAVESDRGGRILVLATPMTIEQEKFKLLLSKYSSAAQIVPVPCMGLMEFVEEGNTDNEMLSAYFSEHLTPYLTEDTRTVVLGCTHYPFLLPQLRSFFGDRDIAIIDGSRGTAAELKHRLELAGLAKDTKGATGSVIIENSSNRQEMIDRSRRLLAMPF